MRRWWLSTGLLLLFPLALKGAGISYSVDFKGLDDSKALKDLRCISQLIDLRKKLPSSVNALRFRAESDIPKFITMLHAYGYLEADVTMSIEEHLPNYSVIVSINPGPLYRIEEYQIIPSTESPTEKVACEALKLENLGICIGDPADTRKILDGELTALHILSQCGYPLASVKNREIIADGNTKGVKILLSIETGPLSYFGHTTIEGNSSVRTFLISQEIQWENDTLYNSCLVEGTQQALMDTGLFSSVFITHGEELTAGKRLPMKIEVAETKHKSISVGASYQKTYGGGVSLGWENRNVNGLGRRFTLQADIAQLSHSGIATYLIPNFRTVGQNFIIQGQADHETIKPYNQQSYSLLTRLDRQMTDCFYFSVGAKFEYLMVTNSVDNGNFFLIEAPIFLRYANIEDVLNPISGWRFEYRGVPALNTKNSSDFYYAQTLTFSSYLPIWNQETLVLAQKLTIGTIFSNGLGAVPVPKRFFGGSEENLRGYKYYTVSPLGEKDKPIGGRSAIFYSVEPRFRISECFGLVPFLDIGNVYLDSWPTFKGKWRKSVGLGFRYFSFLGPLRLDVAFPLNRREGIDPHWWVFVSLGQAF